ncbi:MAG: sulfate adenylyltransferase subunit CysN [Gracilimonas sp.]|uniref:sulfate adenylyltransferase subunit CysN n=1 Tax=Gracilimonas sp. TaxID=1974203 RepID=UPI001B0D6E63|nr:sulfate adenylyltransferase subunit CysN [Gracilimonas sp.]MBO6587168.1 sulfate adenylyltransferase subunit CysN [Gracilimonas sp.]MBO6614344.1 sulfate adenylyltransferase subunit CysN [Gracilimonas sp.]
MSESNGKSNNPNTDNKYLDMDLLRFTTAGSVDDGKSTLIGRLFYDSKSIFEDQMEAIEKSSKSSGEEDVNLALLTDGLKAEREQKITIDVAYRYFATPKRKFIIADTPGHTQYTRNMVTGASTADLAIILVDASKGLLTQSRRHAFISSLLRIPHLVVAVNKMDLVGYDEKVFNEIVSEFRSFAKKLNVSDITYIPISALKGDNVVDKSENTNWYNGSTLLHHLETVKVDASDNIVDFRFPVQYVIRPNQNFRGFSGRVASGHVRPGDEITVLPSGLSSKVKRIVTRDEDLEIAYPGDSITLTIEDEIDTSRGDMIVRKNNVPAVSNEFEAYICWMNEKDMELNKQYVLQHTTRTVQVFMEDLLYRMNVDSLTREDANKLGLNEIGRVKLKTSQPIFYDPYQVNQKTGSFIIIDPATNVTIGAGMIRAGSTESKSPKDTSEAGIKSKQTRQKSPNVVWEPWNIPREEREKRNGHKASLLWFTGISGAGKSTIAKELERKLWENGKQTVLLDGDQVRHGLNGDLGFSAADRTENIRRVGEVARLFYEHGNIVICTFVSPYSKDREAAKQLFPEGDFKEVHITCDPKTAQERDPKGLYKKAQEGEISGLTGYDADYEVSDDPALTIDTDSMSVDEAVEEILKIIE